MLSADKALVFRGWLSDGFVDPEIAALILQELTDTQFDYAVAYYVDGLPLAHIASLRGRTQRTVRRGLNAATAHLVEILQKI